MCLPSRCSPKGPNPWLSPTLDRGLSMPQQEKYLGSFSGILQTAASLSGRANAMQAAQGSPNQFYLLQLLSSMVKT